MGKNYYIIPIFVPHEGCPHDCVFCNQNSITGETHSVDAAYAREVIESCLKTIKNKEAIIEISFYGGTFTAINMQKQKELLAVAKEYKENGLINHIRLSTRPDYIDKEILSNLKNYSVDTIELGIQSMDDEVLLKSGRGHTADQAKNASKLIKGYGFVLGHQIMLGLPGDNFRKDMETTLEVIRQKPDICRIYPALVIKNTVMEKMYKEGTYKPYSLEEAVNISKMIYSMLVPNGIKVIRIGLQPTEEINEGGDVCAGPFHPAFRELVEGSLFCDAIADALKDNKKAENIAIIVNYKDISKLYANKKRYFDALKVNLNAENMKVIMSDEVDRGEIIINIENSRKQISILEYLCKNQKMCGDL